MPAEIACPNVRTLLRVRDSEAGGLRYADHRVRHEGRHALLLPRHFRRGIDHWNPPATDGFAANRPMILFSNAGVASSNGQTLGWTHVYSLGRWNRPRSSQNS
jgi:hypothetical protein